MSLLSISMKAKPRPLFDGLREFLFVGLVPGVVSFTFVMLEPAGDLLPPPGSRVDICRFLLFMVGTIL